MKLQSISREQRPGGLQLECHNCPNHCSFGRGKGTSFQGPYTPCTIWRTTIKRIDNNTHPLSCDDTKATAAAVAALGAKLERGQESWRVWSTGRLTAPQGMIECGESGVTLRFTIPISSLVGKDIWLKGSETLMGRPIEPLIESMKQLGADIRFRGTEVHVKAGRTQRGKCSVTGQYQFSIHLRFAFCRPANGRGAKDETHFALGITRLRINDN